MNTQMRTVSVSFHALKKLFQKRKITYCLPTYNAKDLKLLPPASSVPDGRTHMLLLHCPLSSGYVLGVGLSFSFLVDTGKKKKQQEERLMST